MKLISFQITDQLGLAMHESRYRQVDGLSWPRTDVESCYPDLGSSMTEYLNKYEVFVRLEVASDK